MEFKMNIVVLCGGNSTEREVSINSGSMVCEALRKKNHNAILMDVYFGLEDIDIFEKSASEYDVESVKKNIQSLSDKVSEDRRSFFGNNVIEICQKADIVFMERMVKTESVRQLLIYMVLNIQVQAILQVQ